MTRLERVKLIGHNQASIPIGKSRLNLQQPQKVKSGIDFYFRKANLSCIQVVCIRYA